jgi:hypothetical protein
MPGTDRNVHPLIALMGNVGATLLYQVRHEDTRLEVYQANGRVFIVQDGAAQHHPHGEGSQVYIPADGGADDLDATLDALHAYVYQEGRHEPPETDFIDFLVEQEKARENEGQSSNEPS